MGKIMEAVFCVAYLIVTTILGIKIIYIAKEDKESKLFGIMSLVLVSGDAFHLVPRILSAIGKTKDYTAAMGIGTAFSIITIFIYQGALTLLSGIISPLYCFAHFIANSLFPTPVGPTITSTLFIINTH